MKVFELHAGGGRLMEAINRQRAQDAVRSGLHCSTICDDIIQTLHPAKFRAELADSARFSYQEVGNVLEDLIASRLRRRQGWRKPEPRADEYGIIGSPDGDSPRIATIDEVKATWTSERNFLESTKFLRYTLQIQFYLYVWGYQRARLHVLFINGSYRPPIPNPRTWVLRFDRLELKRTHDMLVQHAADRGWLLRETIRRIRKRHHVD